MGKSFRNEKEFDFEESKSAEIKQQKQPEPKRRKANDKNLLKRWNEADPFDDDFYA